MAYDVLIEATEPGAKVEANGQIVGQTPLHLKIFGDPDRTFHDFGSDYYVIRALPLATNQYSQILMFGTGRWFGPEDRIPERLSFDMNRRPPEPPPGMMMYPYGYPYAYPAYPYSYGPSPFYYGPSFYYGGGHYYHHYGHHHGGGGIHVHPRQ
jgi:hypothetical protein